MSDSPASILFNIDGYDIGTTLDGYTYRLQTENSVKPGSSFTSSPIPSDLSLLISQKLTNLSSSNMLVDGSVTPVTFKLTADSVQDIKLSELRIVFSASNIEFVGTRFGTLNAPLINGVKIQIKSNGATTDLATLNVNEDFLLFHSTNSIFWDPTGSKDTIAIGYLLGGAVVLKAGTDDYLGITIQDNLTSPGLSYFQAVGYGIKEI